MRTQRILREVVPIICIALVATLNAQSQSEQEDCECSGSLSRPKTFELNCDGNLFTFPIKNEDCDEPMRVPEWCLSGLPVYEVVGSSCNFNWTPEFAVLGIWRRPDDLCWSAVTLAPCQGMVRWLSVVVCSQQQCIDCEETDEEGGARRTKRWCRTRTIYTWDHGQRIIPLFYACCPSPGPVVPVDNEVTMN